MPWIWDVGYTVLLVALLIAFMGHMLFGDFEYTMNTLPASISGLHPFPTAIAACIVASRTKLIMPCVEMKCLTEMHQK